MLTNQDIQKMMNVFVTRSEFEKLAEDVEIIKEKVNDLPEKLDIIAKSFSDLRDKYVAVKVQTDRHESWIHKIADKTEVKLEY